MQSKDSQLTEVVLEGGLGWQNIFADMQTLSKLAKFIFLDEGLYLLVLGIIKISILIMYYRVFPLRGFKIATWIVGSAVVAWTFGFGGLCEYH